MFVLTSAVSNYKKDAFAPQASQPPSLGIKCATEGAKGGEGGRQCAIDRKMLYGQAGAFFLPRLSLLYIRLKHTKSADGIKGIPTLQILAIAAFQVLL
jgi:hypothetical protein